MELASPVAHRRKRMRLRSGAAAAADATHNVEQGLSTSAGKASRLEDLLSDSSLGPEVCAFNSGEDLRNLSHACRASYAAVKHFIALRWRHQRLEERIRVGPTDELRSVRLERQTPRSMEFLQRLVGLFEMQSSPEQLPDCNYIQRRYSNLNVGENRFLSPVLRQVLVDWMAEVCATELQQPLPVLHSAVRILDQVLGRILITPREVLLAACVAILVENHGLLEDHENTQARKSERAAGAIKSESHLPRLLGVQDVVFVTANQFNGFEVCKSYNIIISQCKTAGETPQRTKPTVLDWLALLGDDLLYGEYQGILNAGCQSLNVFNGLRSIHSWDCHVGTEAIKTSEKKGLIFFLANIALLDYGTLKFLPSTMAIAILLLAECTSQFYASLERKDDSETNSPRIEDGGPAATYDAKLGSKGAGDSPEGAVSNAKISGRADSSFVGLRDFIRSSDAETESIEKAVWRIWQLQRDYLDFISARDMQRATVHGVEPAGCRSYSRLTRYWPCDVRCAWGATFLYSTGDRLVQLPRVLEPHPNIRGHLRGMEQAFQAHGIDMYIAAWIEKGPTRPSHVQRILSELVN